MGALTHYFFFAFLFILAVCFGIYLLKNKRFKETILYVLTMMITAVVSIAIFPAMLKHIFGGYRGNETINNLKGSLSDFIGAIKIIASALLKDIYGNTVGGTIIVGTLVVITIIIVLFNYIKRMRNKGTDHKTINPNCYTRMFITIITMLFYFLVVTKATPIKEYRYFAPIYPLIIILTVIGMNFILSKVIPKQSIVILLLLVMSVVPISIYIARETPAKKTEAQKLSEKYQDYDAIFALHDPRDGVTNYFVLSNSYQLSQYNKFYIIYETELDPLDDETLSNEEQLIVTINDLVDKDTIMKYLMDYTGLSKETYLYRGDEGDSDTYLLTR